MSLYPVPQNLLLERVPEDLLRGKITLRQFADGDIFFRTDEPLREIIFPLRGVISVAMSDGAGRFVEVGMISREGMVGLPLFLGSERAPWTATARTSGEAFVMEGPAFRDLVNSCPDLGASILRYTHLILYQLAQLAVCRGAHSIEKRSARWLLTMRDRVERNTFPLTQEFFARTLGVRTASINAALSSLSKQGMVRYERGHLTITDADKLEKAACKCHELIQHQLRLFTQTVSSCRS